MVTAASDQLSSPPWTIRLIDTVAAAGSVETSVAPGTVRLEVELAATPTSTMENITTDRLGSSVTRVNSASGRPRDAVDGFGGNEIARPLIGIKA